MTMDMDSKAAANALARAAAEFGMEPVLPRPWKEMLQGFPAEFRYLPVLTGKTPWRPDTKSSTKWEEHPGIPLDQLVEMNGVVKSVSLQLGQKSGGLLYLDPDTPKFKKAFQKHLARDICALPKTTRHSSGRAGVQSGYLYRVPEDRWAELDAAGGVKKFSLEPGAKPGAEDFEIYWQGHCVIAGSHPNNKRDGKKCAPGEGDGQGFYSFDDNASPLDIEVAEAPRWLIDFYVREEESKETKKKDAEPEGDFPLSDAARACEFLERVFQPAEDFSNYKEWLEIGMILNHTSLRAGEPELLYEPWLKWCEGMSNFDEKGCEYEWSRWTAKGLKDNQLGFNTLVRKVQLLGGDIKHPSRLKPEDFKPGSWLHKGHVKSKEIWAEIKRQSEVVEVDAKAASINKIAASMEELYQLELEGESAPGTYARMRYERSVLGGFRMNQPEVDRKLLLMVAEKHDIPIGDGKKKERQGQSLLGARSSSDGLKELLPGFLFEGMDAIVAGVSSSGKTMAVMGQTFSVATGFSEFLDCEVGPKKTGAVLWIGTDGADNARDMAEDYAKQVVPPDGDHLARFNDRFKFWGANKETGETPWAFNVKGLNQLFQELERGHESGPYKLLVIDSLKAVMSLGGIDFGIGPVDWAMRLMQGAAAKYGVTVLWIHHLKPGAGRAGVDIDIDSLGGNSNIGQIPYSVHIIHKINRKGHGLIRRWQVKKHRGKQERYVDYKLGDSYGFQLVTAEDAADCLLDVLVHLWVKREEGGTKTDLTDSIDINAKTLGNRLTQMGKDGVIKYLKKRWWITGAGLEKLKELMPELSQEIDGFKASSADTQA